MKLNQKKVTSQSWEKNVTDGPNGKHTNGQIETEG